MACTFSSKCPLIVGDDSYLVTGIAQSVLRFAKRWTVQVSNPSVGRELPYQSGRAQGPTQPPVQQASAILPGITWSERDVQRRTPSSNDVKEQVALCRYTYSVSVCFHGLI